MDKPTAYQEILRLCRDCGIIPDTYMTEEQLFIFIEKLLEHIMKDGERYD